MSASGVDRARDVLEGAGLALPFVPPELEGSFRERVEWCFASREISPIDMYLFRRYLFEAMTEEVPDYVAISHAGHGVNSYAITYHLVRGPLAIFAQAGWGGVYMDREQSTREVVEQLKSCASLAAAAEDLADALPPSPARLVVACSPFRWVGVCRWLERPFIGDKDEADSWLAGAWIVSASVFERAHDLLLDPQI